MKYFACVICLVIGYFLGCISTGYLVGKFYHIDIRTKGSGNAGTTNVLRNLGKLPALITFMGDLGKAIIPILIIRLLFLAKDPAYCYLLCLYMGFGVVLGHNFPFQMGFKGGKGVAVTAAFLYMTCPLPMVPIGTAIFVIAVALTRYVSVGSLIVALYAPVSTTLQFRNDPLYIHMMVISLLFTILSYVQHRQNIVRLIHGNENPLFGKKKEEQKAEASEKE